MVCFCCFYEFCVGDYVREGAGSYPGALVHYTVAAIK